MHCAKIGTECPYRVIPDTSYIFVLMPFENSASIFDSIKQAGEGLEKKKFVCERADVQYTSLDIWCHQICRSIRRAKYLIVDTTGMNANVFYELGFAHALGHTKNIIITRDVEKLPFDISGYSAIQYTEKDFPKLRKDLQKALMDLEAETAPEIEKNQNPEEIIQELKDQLREEEDRSRKFKEELRGSENREWEFRKRIEKLKAIEENPLEETEKLISKKDQEIRKLQRKMDLIDQKKGEEVSLLQKRLEEERQRHQNLKQELEKFKQTGDEETLSQSTSQAKKKDWQTELLKQAIALSDKDKFEEAINFLNQIIEKSPDHQSAYSHRAKCLYKIKDFEGAIADYNKHIELAQQSAGAYINRGLAFEELKDFKRAIEDYNKGIELDPKYAIAYSRRGVSFAKLKKFKRAIEDFHIAIELDPKYATARLNLTEILIISGEIGRAEDAAKIAIDFAQSIKDKAIGNYLHAICLKLQGKDTKKVETKFKELCSKDFETLWSFYPFEDWLADADISKDAKNYIHEITEILKKHKSDE